MRILPRSLLGQYHLSATAGICLWLPICKLDLCSMEPSSPKQETVSEEHYYQRYTAALYGGAIQRGVQLHLPVRLVFFSCSLQEIIKDRRILMTNYVHRKVKGQPVEWRLAAYKTPVLSLAIQARLSRQLAPHQPSRK